MKTKTQRCCWMSFHKIWSYQMNQAHHKTHNDSCSNQYISHFTDYMSENIVHTLSHIFPLTVHQSRFVCCVNLINFVSIFHLQWLHKIHIIMDMVYIWTHFSFIIIRNINWISHITINSGIRNDVKEQLHWFQVCKCDICHSFIERKDIIALSS